jgi:spore germination cell wall hydrolase CwlJ-like protein
MAVRQALKEPMFQSDTVYYANIKTATDSNFINEVILKNEVCRIGNHVFAREVRR